MAETTEQRITQLESIVNELTARVEAEPTNVDLPPLLAAAKAELADLQAPPAAPAAPEPAPAPTEKAAPAAPAPAPAPAKSIFRRAPVAAPAAPAKAVAKPKMAIKPMPPTVPAIMKATRPNPAARRPAPVDGTSRSGK